DTMNLLAQAVKPIDDGYLVLGGYVTLNTKAIYVLKLDLTGNLLWFKHIEEGSNVDVVEDGKFVTATPDSNFTIIYATKKPNNQGEMNLVKFTQDGSVLWKKKYTDASTKLARHVINTSDNGFIMAGVQAFEGEGIARYYILKTDGAGNFEWEKTYELNIDSRAFSIQETPWDGGFIIGGYAYNTASGTGNYDAWVIKTNYLGDTLWTRTYGDPLGNDCAALVIPLTTLEEYFFEGKPIEYLLTGCMYISSVRYMYLAKLDEFGNIIWEKKYNSIGGYNPSAIQTYPIIHRSNNVVENRSFIGVSLYRPNLTQQNRIIKFYYNGTIAWHKTATCDADADVYIKDMQPTPDGGYVLAGYRYDVPQKGWILKIDAQGNYCTPVGCDSTVVVSAAETAGLPNRTPKSLVQINPNPVRGGGVLTLSHQLPAEFPVAQFTLYNQLGKAVWQQEFNTWDRTKILQLPPGVPSGLYLWQVTYMGEAAASGKIVLE
ncbi:MAG TPA: hypothetical protein PK239_10645, partial [Chitinophagales bacterium]|nr:hypothetical protein [Chitinophagales bacterium]